MDCLMAILKVFDENHEISIVYQLEGLVIHKVIPLHLLMITLVNAVKKAKI
jgi:hypothetical protein